MFRDDGSKRANVPSYQGPAVTPTSRRIAELQLELPPSGAEETRTSHQTRWGIVVLFFAVSAMLGYAMGGTVHPAKTSTDTPTAAGDLREKGLPQRMLLPSQSTGKSFDEALVGAAATAPPPNTSLFPPGHHHLPHGARGDARGHTHKSPSSQSDDSRQQSVDAAAAEEIAKNFFDDERNLWAALLKGRCKTDWKEVVQIQLANWKVTGITEASLDRYCIRNSIRISIVNGEIRGGYWYFKRNSRSRIKCALWLLHMTILRAQAFGLTIPDVEMVFQGTDGAQSTVKEEFLWDDAGPLFSNVKCEKDASVSFPMGFHDQFGAFYGDMSLTMYDQKFTVLKKEYRPPAWKTKESSILFTSGSSAGAGLRGHRIELAEIKSPLLKVEDTHVPLEEYAKHRYQVYAYGRCGWSRRIRELSFMKAVVFAEASPCREYFYDALRPGTDYVPVAEDFSNLAEEVARVHKHPKRAEEMANAWVDRASDFFALPCVLDYVWELLNEYARLQRFKPQPRPTWERYDFREEMKEETDDHKGFLKRKQTHLDPKQCKEKGHFGNILTC